MKYKMYCIFSKPTLTDLKGIRGKLASQSGHAFCIRFGMLKVDSQNILKRIEESVMWSVKHITG